MASQWLSQISITAKLPLLKLHHARFSATYFQGMDFWEQITACSGTPWLCEIFK
jgi:hypothetical protein